jgi:hypothetical protein
MSGDIKSNVQSVRCFARTDCTLKPLRMKDRVGSGRKVISALRKNLRNASFCGAFEILAVRIHFFHEGERLDEDTGLARV